MTALSSYLRECRTIHANPDTTEPSYYAAIEKLLDAGTDERIRTHSGLTRSRSDKPDLGLYEENVAVLFVEVKLPTVSAAELLNLEQARRYADALAGWVLITNLNDFVLARIDDDALVEQQRARLFEGELFASQQPKPIKGAGELLSKILAVGCAPQRTLRQPSEVASILAAHAGELADVLPKSGLGQIKKGFKVWLGAALDDAFLVSTTAQAIVYGMFAAWLESKKPEEFRWQDARDGLELGVIADIVYSALSPAVVKAPRVDALLEGVATVLRRVNRDALAEQFDRRAIEYFYEPFLEAYDPKLRDALGVWYTPREIAAYQVARADHHLRTDLGIADGLADESVIVLDPAVGTGTYLAAVYDHLMAYHKAQGDSPSEAAGLVREAAQTRLVGFDILPAALLVADLHLRRVLRRLGVPLASGKRPSVYLTNSLTGWRKAIDPQQLSIPWEAAKKEIDEANRYKRKETVLVVLGNPPYEGYSSADTADERALVKPWIDPLRGDWGVRKHRLNDLYVRFWAAAALRIADFTGTGIVTFITNRKWLTGRSYPAMREDLLTRFDKIIVDDLGGDSRGSGGHSQDESVFTTSIAGGVQIGTAIVTAVRFPESNSTMAGVHNDDPARTNVVRRKVLGTAAEKREHLSRFRTESIDSGVVPLPTDRRSRWKLGAPSDINAWPSLDKYFSYKNSGVQPVRDLVVTDYDKAALRSRMEDYFDPDVTWDDLVRKYPRIGVSQARYDAPKVRGKLLQRNEDHGAHGLDPRRLVRCLWRPLDGRWLYWEPDHKLLNEPRSELIPYWRIPKQICLVSTGTRRRPGAARPLVSQAVPVFHAMDPDARTLPLWAPPVGAREGELALGEADADQSSPDPNIVMDWIHAARDVGVPGSDSDVAETVFYAICGVVASESWLATQPVEHDDFPTVPLPSDPSELAAAAETGRAYSRLVDPCVDVEGITRGNIRQDLRGIVEPDPVSGADPVLEYGSRGRSGGRRVAQDLLWGVDGGWRHISDDILSFTLGGWNPIRKHLSYWVGEQLTHASRRRVTTMARRIVAIQQLTQAANVHFAAAEADPLEPA